MRINGAKLFIKNLGWLVGLCFFLLAVFFPSLPASVFYQASTVFRPQSSLFLYTGSSGGIFWHVRDYLQWQSYVHNPSNGRTLFTDFAPYCFIPVTLFISTIITWQWIVSRPKDPKLLIVRSLLAAVVAFVGSLILTYLLDVVGGHLLLAVISVRGVGNLEIRDLISGVWQTSISQAIWLFLPCLGLGALLAWWQQTLWRKHLLVQPIVP